MTDEIAFLGIADASRRMRDGTLSPVEIIDACLARIEAHEGRLDSFLHLDTEGARAAARRAGEVIARGGEIPALLGLPVGMKDLFDTADMPTTYNSALFQDRRPRRDAAAVRRLRASGAIVLGKLAAWECGVGGTSFTLPWPPARNPWALDRDPGGSSSGSGAAVAAGFCFGALGSDTGGSIREPASWCGVAGLKPTFGLVSGEGSLAASFSLDHAGPMARSSADCAHLLDALAASRERAFSAGIGDGVDGIRIGVVDLGGEADLTLEPDVASTVETAAAALAALGAVVSPVRLPPLALFSAVVTVLAAAEGFALHRHSLAGRPQLYDPLTRQRLMAGAQIGAADYVDAKCLRQRLIAEVAGVFAAHDLLLMPATRTAAPLLGGFDSHGGHPSLARPWNVTGYPALAVRAGFSADGLPLSVQIAGRAYGDALVLRAGHALESALGVSDRRPGFMNPDVAVAEIPPPGDAEAADALNALSEKAVALVRGEAARGGRPAASFRPRRIRSPG